MKNQKLSSRSLSTLLSLAVIVLLTSCGSEAQNKKPGKEAPAIDIHTAVVTK